MFSEGINWIYIYYLDKFSCFRGWRLSLAINLLTFKPLKQTNQIPAVVWICCKHIQTSVLQQPLWQNVIWCLNFGLWLSKCFAYLWKWCVFHNFSTQITTFDGAKVLLVWFAVASILVQHIRCTCFHLRFTDGIPKCLCRYLSYETTFWLVSNKIKNQHKV